MENDFDTDIYFKTLPEKRGYRTFVFNLDKHLTQTATNNVIKRLKQHLGTSCVFKTTPFGTGFGFRGEQQDKIQDFLITRQIIRKIYIKN